MINMLHGRVQTAGRRGGLAFAEVVVPLGPRRRALNCALAVLVLVSMMASCSGSDDNEESQATRATTPSPSPLLVSDVSGLTGGDQVTLAALQGLANRAGANVWLTGFTPHEGTPVGESDAIVRAEIVKRTEEAVRPFDLVRRLRGSIRGLVVWDPALLIDTQNVATSLAGQLDALPVSPETAVKLARSPYSFETLVDLREQRFTTRADAYEWALDQLPGGRAWAFPAWIGDGLGRGTGNEPALRDWVVANRGFAFEANAGTEPELLREILTAFPEGSPVYGYIFYADEAYLNGGLPVLEGLSVTEISEAGQHLIPTIDSYNLSLLSQTTSTRPTPTWDSSVRTPDPTGKYVTFILSDGDNVSYDQNYLLARIWPNPDRQRIPLGITVSLQLQHLAPALWDHYVTTAGNQSVLVAGPSGAGYAYPSPMPNLPDFLTETRQLMDSAGLRSMWILDNGALASPPPAIASAFADALQPDGLFSDYVSFAGGVVTPNPPVVSFAGAGEVPVVHDVFALNVDLAVTQIRETIALAGDQPGFVFVGMNAWEMGPTEAAAIMDRLGPGYTAVRPDHFIGLIEGAKESGLIAPRLLDPIPHP